MYVYVHRIYLMAIWYIKYHLIYFTVIWYSFPEKSGNAVFEPDVSQ
jgi:hypothetical protein